MYINYIHIHIIFNFSPISDCSVSLFPFVLLLSCSYKMSQEESNINVFEQRDLLTTTIIKIYWMLF